MKCTQFQNGMKKKLMEEKHSFASIKKKETSNFYDNERQQYIYGNMGSSCI